MAVTEKGSLMFIKLKIIFYQKMNSNTSLNVGDDDDQQPFIIS